MMLQKLLLLTCWFHSTIRTFNLEDETISILYQKYILDCTSGLMAYAFIHSLLWHAKQATTSHMPKTPAKIYEAENIGQYEVKLKQY